MTLVFMLNNFYTFEPLFLIRRCLHQLFFYVSLTNSKYTRSLWEKSGAALAVAENTTAGGKKIKVPREVPLRRNTEFSVEVANLFLLSSVDRSLTVACMYIFR